MSAPLTLPLTSVGSADAGLAGGKGAMLGELLRRDHHVPDGFVVTTAAYELAASRLGAAGPETSTIDEGPVADARRVRQLLSTGPVPAPVERAIVDAYAALGGGPVAVRSSSTTEDLAGGAFAGQHDTYLNVVGADAVVDAVRRCWASLWAERAVAYRQGRGMESEDARIAVVVQRMVDATAAGVLFTANPVTGARDELVLDASAGLGEAVVSGLVTPDHYRLAPDGQVLECRLGRREVVIRSAAGGGLVRDESRSLPAERLPQDTLVRLARLGRTLATELGRPQDIEWALAGGEIWLLQARPLTAVPPPPMALTRAQRRIGPQVLEMLPVRPYPLDMTMWIGPGLGRMVERMLGEMAGVHVDFATALPEVEGVVDRFVPPRPRPTLGMPRAVLHDMRRARRFRSGAWTSDGRFEEFNRRADHLASIDVGARTWEGLVAAVDDALETLHLVTDLRVDYLPHAFASLLRLRLVLQSLGRTDLFAALVTGAPTRTQDANRALEDLAALVRSDHTLRADFAARDAQTLLQQLDDPALRSFREALEGFLAEYGHRETTSVLLISEPTWSDAPRVALEAVTALIDEPPATARAAETALTTVRRHPAVRRSVALRRVVEGAVEAARSGIALREDTHFHATRSLQVLRHLALEMGRRLVSAGALDAETDVFHLRLEELRVVSPGVGATASHRGLRDVVRDRSARRAELAGAPLTSPLSLFPDGDDVTGALVTGAGGGGGRASGPVRVIRGPAEFGRLRAGDVLVCPYTNPAWTPLFRRAAAIVVDTGGVASHAAIVAREYGVPAVLATGAGTARLTEGQHVVVDGDRGVVTAAPSA